MAKGLTGVSDGFFSPNGKLAIVRGDGAIYEWNAATQQFSTTRSVASPIELSILSRGLALRTEQKSIRLRSHNSRWNGYIGGTPSLRQSTWRQLGRINTSVPFWSASISNDGKFVMPWFRQSTACSSSIRPACARSAESALGERPP